MENTLYYRYFNSIKVSEYKTENEVVVVMSVNSGIIHSSIAYELKKENEIWKMNILHLMDYFKEKNK